MNSLIIYMFIALAFGIIFLFFYIFMRDKNIEKKFQRIGAALEEMNREIYNLQKTNREHSKNLELEIDRIISNKIDDVGESLLKILKDFKYQSSEEIKSLYDKVEKIENRVKETALPNIDDLRLEKKDDKERVKELFEIGYSIEEIAKELELTAGEVQLLLKF